MPSLDNNQMAETRGICVYLSLPCNFVGHIHDTTRRFYLVYKRSYSPTFFHRSCARSARPASTKRRASSSKVANGPYFCFQHCKYSRRFSSSLAPLSLLTVLTFPRSIPRSIFRHSFISLAITPKTSSGHFIRIAPRGPPLTEISYTSPEISREI